MLGIGIILAVIFTWVQWTVTTKYSSCIVFWMKNNAQSAFICGNHYFGVYGSSGYDVKKAEYYFGKAVEIDPKTPDAWHQYARVAFLRGDFSTAMYRINKQFEERGDELMSSYYIRGLIEGYMKDYPAAEKDFRRFLEWDPHNWAGNNDLSWIYFAQGKFKEAADQSSKGLGGSSPNPWLLVMHAMSMYNLGHKKVAEMELGKARESAQKLTEEQWAHAYPGNDPKIAGKGLTEFRKIIEQDIELVHNDISGE